MTLPPVLFFGNDWDAENRTSSHHIARVLSRKTPLVYLECPGLRSPSGTGRDAKKVVKKVRRFLEGTRVRDGVSVRTLLQLPMHSHPRARRFNRDFLVNTVRFTRWKLGWERPLLWFMVPHVASVVGKVGECGAVYYCIDRYASLPGVEPDAIAAYDADLTRRANLVFVASATLLDEKVRLNPRTYLSPHGVDHVHFGKASREGEMPAELQHIRGPIVGFFGLVERWIDLRVIDRVAAERPDWNVVIVGRVAVGDVPQRSNIHWLGPRPYEQLPDYGRHFDVSIIPYHLTSQVIHANPLKLREYLAMGKPVVSVSTPEIDNFAEVVYIVRSPDDFVRTIDLAMKEDSAERQRARMLRAARESWESRLENVVQTVEQALHS